MKPIEVDPSWIKVQFARSMVPGTMVVRAHITVHATGFCEEAETESFIEVVKQRLIDVLGKPSGSDEYERLNDDEL